MKVEEYYYTFYPKLDLWSNEQIKFRDYETYFEAVFTNRENLSKWFMENHKTDEAKELAKELFLQRKKRKQLTFAPCQVELRTIISPSVVGIEQMFGTYDAFLKIVDLKPRFNYSSFLSPKNEEIEVLIDTREQQPMSFSKSKVAKLDTGDYTAGKDHYCDVYVERKSVSDFFSTFYTVENFKRVKKEFERAKELGFYLFVLIEDSLTNCLKFKTRFVRDTNLISHTFKNVRTIIEQYPAQFVFCKNRAHMKDVILKILSLGDKAPEFDFEYLTETGRI
jgi:hypothetical protein